MDGSRDHVANIRRPRVAIALGGGGARGIAHVLALEALDELGIRPVAIAGTSMGAVVAAAYAAGIEGRAIRAHVLQVFRNRSDVMGKLFGRELVVSPISCCEVAAILCCWIPRFASTCFGRPACQVALTPSRRDHHCGDELSRSQRGCVCTRAA